MELLLQASFAGVANGLIYGLIGMGLAVIFKGTRILNAMHGEFGVLGAMTTVLLLNRLGLPYPVAIIAGCALGAVLGMVVDMVLVRPMLARVANEDSFLLMTIGLATALSASVLYFVGRDGQVLPQLGGEGAFIVFGAVLRKHVVWLVVAALATALAIHVFFRRSTLGLAMIAAAVDADGAVTIGIPVVRMRTLSFVIGGMIGALAGILLTPLYSINYAMGLSLTLKGFAAAILGGLANPMGALIGGLTFGLLEALAVVWAPTAYADVIALSLLILIMIFLPHGLLCRAGRQGG